MIIKVCGMRDAENIREVETLFTLHSSLFTFWMGFIFWPKSSRYVSERPAYLPEHVKRVGVFVDEDVEQICRIAHDFALDIIQLHGHESPEFISHLSPLTSHPSPLTSHLSIIKAFNIATAADLSQTAPYEGLVDYFLFDTKATLPGGSGQQFDWTVLDAYKGDTPYLLSGGIGPSDADRLKTFLTSHLSPLTSHPSPLTSKKCYGIDLNSRFESSPALKDVNQLKEFIKKLR